MDNTKFLFLSGLTMMMIRFNFFQTKFVYRTCLIASFSYTFHISLLLYCALYNWRHSYCYCYPAFLCPLSYERCVCHPCDCFNIESVVCLFFCCYFENNLNFYQPPAVQSIEVKACILFQMCLILNWLQFRQSSTVLLYKHPKRNCSVYICVCGLSRSCLLERI